MLQAIYELIGYSVVAALLRILTFGKLRAAPGNYLWAAGAPSERKRYVGRDPDGTIVLQTDIAVLVGLVVIAIYFVAIVLIGQWLATWLSN